MFHFWHNTITLPQANLTEPALYAVASTRKPFGVYAASPLSASECVRAKQGSGWSGTTVRELTGTVANVMLASSPSKLMEPRVGSTNGNPMGTIAGGTGSVAHLLKTGVSLRGNDGRQDMSFVSGDQQEARAMDATAPRSASFLALAGKSYQIGCPVLHG